MTSKYRSLEELRTVRRSYIESARSNNFEDGLRSLLADLYPDNAHFIYELLQNAEDANAHSVQFDLAPDKLTVLHDGTRLFGLADVESITGIGQSTKKDDETQIGKFGVGFKAVFAYTNRPEVRSGEFAFAIEDLFVPEELPAQSPDELTVFVFPFDRAEKSPERAFQEIERGLLELNEATVLFLNHVRDISFTIAGGKRGQVVRHDDVGQRIRIGLTVEDETSESSWLRLVGSVGEGKGVPKDTQVAAAFSLATPAGRPQGVSRQRVVPLDRGETCIYFPAAKESSGLRFHIHAPFASTVARDSVRDTSENSELLLAVADLIAEQLLAFRDDGYIDDGLLAALPNADDVLSAPYAAMRDRILDQFRRSDITPVFGGRGFARSESLWTSPVEFRRFLDPEDLPTLLALQGRTSIETAQWIAPREGRAGRFLQSLEVLEFGWDEFDEILGSVDHVPEWLEETDREVAENRIVRWAGWLGAKAEDKLSAVYEMIGLGRQNKNLWQNLRSVPLIRIWGDADLVTGPSAYLPETPEDRTAGRVPPALAFFPDEEATPKKSHLEAFYEGAGVKRWDIRAQIDLRLRPYRQHSWPELQAHLDDIGAFAKYAAERPTDVALFKGIHFLQVDSPDPEDTLWATPADAFLDDPFLSTGLTSLHALRRSQDEPRTMHPIADVYVELGDDFVDFAVKVGCQIKLAIVPSRVQDNPAFQWSWARGRESAYTVARDWDIPDFDRAVETGNHTLLGALWQIACEAPGARATAMFQQNRSSIAHPLPSSIAQRMKESKWILDIDGEVRTSSGMTLARLPAGWPHPAPDSLASRIEFGSDASALEEEAGTRLQEASHLGVPIDLVDRYKALGPDGQARVLEFMAAEIEGEGLFPESASADPVRRAAVVAGDAKDALEWQTETRERQVTLDSDVRENGRTYLRELYTDSNGDMWCQACQSRMPFKVKGSWFFVAVQCVRSRQYQHPQNALALCPLCAARYKYVRNTSDDQLLAAIDILKVDADQGTVALPVSLDGRRVELLLVGKHAIDLKAAFAVAGQGRDQAAEA